MPVKLVAEGFDKIAYIINTGTNTTANSTDLFYTAGEISKSADGIQTITYTLSDSSGKSISHKFTIRPQDYMIDWTVDMSGADKLFSQNSLNLLWQVEARQHEMDIQSEKRETQIGLMEKVDLIISLWAKV
jgi:YidC/Oxa1 family membrane protein insertase